MRSDVEKLTEVLIELVSNAPPDRTVQLAEMVRALADTGDTGDTGSLTCWAANPRAKKALGDLIVAWKEVAVTPAELGAMLTAGSAAYHRAKGEQEIELVWTGPSSQLIATRKTEQALLEVIGAARAKIFITSFVAYNVAAIMSALHSATDRGVEISMLLESSDKHGGGVSIDAIAHMRTALPTARIYFWHDKDESFAGGKVHAKVAVCDGKLCFISSANLTGYAMERNIEAGVLIRGGALPRSLHDHLEALVTIKVLKA
jgi:phosphatidylserine/phosphatidylglycerophosphate/cardiolipin synthase-like enzyme